MGTGEALNEHIVDSRWPPLDERLEMLEEACYATGEATARNAVRAIQQYVDAGYDEVYVNQIGGEQDAFFGFYAREVLPRLR